MVKFSRKRHAWERGRDIAGYTISPVSLLLVAIFHGYQVGKDCQRRLVVLQTRPQIPRTLEHFSHSLLSRTRLTYSR